MDIYTAVKNELKKEIVQTENGADAYRTSGSELVDLNFSVVELRSGTDDDIRRKFADAYSAGPAEAATWMFFARDVRGGMGERRTFRVCYNWLAGKDPETAEKLMELVPEYGRWDDLFCLVGTRLEGKMTDFISEQLVADNEKMKEGKPVSLLAKWMPSITTSSKETVDLARRFAKALCMSDKVYRKTLSALRAHIGVLEAQISANKWNEVDYARVCSMANIKYRNAFLAHDNERRLKYLDDVENGSAKINSAVAFPSDVVSRYDAYAGEDATFEAMWKNLPDYVKKDCIVVCDSSGSMMTKVGSGATALDVSLSLAVYFAEHIKNPKLKNRFITFSRTPRLVDLSACGSLRDKLLEINKYTEYSNTDVEKVFDLLLNAAVSAKIPQNEIPDVLVISDMNFDQGVARTSGSLMDGVAEKWRSAGYVLPKCIYWNVCGGEGRVGPVPAQSAENGVCLVSGFSPSVAKMMASGEVDPYGALLETLRSERYRPVATVVGLS